MCLHSTSACEKSRMIFSSCSAVVSVSSSAAMHLCFSCRLRRRMRRESGRLLSSAFLLRSEYLLLVLLVLLVPFEETVLEFVEIADNSEASAEEKVDRK